MSANLTAVSAAIDAVHKAFGAPGDYGYGTPKGDALIALYRSEINLDRAEEVFAALAELASASTSVGQHLVYNAPAMEFSAAIEKAERLLAAA
ncbi:hypothetical protein [Rhizobium rhizogenes]|uniref:hypothetical protein n=1 Tax=Rhizobium rhizogenes TaxID=359 RepID=UPI0015741BA1|nr:hypothetical protein [Rhizobium rhizogenes]NTG07203.1 hypothetical protein [Rhizobium rhizogenes]